MPSSFFRLPMLLLAFILALFALATRQCEGQRTRTSVYRRAAARDASDSIYEVAFTSAEEDLMKAKQRDDAHIIAGFLPGKSAYQVARKCVEMGLKCGDVVAPPERNSEQWRNLPRRRN